MVGKLLLRGMLVGILAGLLAVGFGRWFGEPSVDRAIAFEEAGTDVAHATAPAHADAMDHDYGGHDHGDDEAFSRTTQKGIGLLTAGVMYGAGLGGLFALAFAVAYGRIGRLGARATAALTAGAGFVAFTLVPLLKYPPNPPAVGDPDTIGIRTALFFGLIALSVAALVMVVLAGRRFAMRMEDWSASGLAALLFVGLIGLCYAALPAVNEVPSTFPAATLWEFRIASLGMQAVVWATMGFVFGWLAEDLLTPRATIRPVAYG